MCFKEADILLPEFYGDKNLMQKWAVIACDQYTSDIKYWENIREQTQKSKTSLDLIFPEIYLELENKEKQNERIEKIAENMREYKKNMREFRDAMFLIRRELKDGSVRFGIIGAADLDAYNFETGEGKIKATEKTVSERLPVRVKIRENASLELPHVMLLYNDRENIIIKNLIEKNLPEIYNFELIGDAGKISARLLGHNEINFVKEQLEIFGERDKFSLAVGDGNHSLAAAKICHEKFGKNKYALAEIVNIYDESLKFEPIYRILKGVELELVQKEMKKFGFKYNDVETFWKRDLMPLFKIMNNSWAWTYYYKNNNREDLRGDLSVKILQDFLDSFIAKHGGNLDYIHGEHELFKLVEHEKSDVGFVFEGINKSELFGYVAKNGVLPRKSFSMGLADDKRFYVEAGIIN